MRSVPENHDYTGESGGFNLNAERRKRLKKKTWFDDDRYEDDDHLLHQDGMLSLSSKTSNFKKKKTDGWEDADGLGVFFFFRKVLFS